jgi:hypothetical protein
MDLSDFTACYPAAAPALKKEKPGAFTTPRCSHFWLGRYRASGFGRIWNFTILPLVPFPPSMCHTKCVP